MKITQLLFLLALVLLSSCRDKDNNLDDSILGKWEIKEFMSLESVLYAKDADYSPIIEFNDDGTYSLQLDRNGCVGSFEFGDDDAISISAAGCTKICCDSDFSEKATAMLPQVERFVLQKNELELHVPGWGWLVLNKVSN
ncbi:META domain-containing protein [Maribellus sediminis]|uniref:META domain-containing protein n=1 Tax=Maribellus sediminis TaxID=2696285 RepID=UPI00143097C0|nr:META domain-containing protein [Maribellus sediminis]